MTIRDAVRPAPLGRAAGAVGGAVPRDEPRHRGDRSARRGLLVAVNPAYAAMHGGAVEDFVGLPVAARAHARRPPSGCPSSRADARSPGEMITYESEHVRADGSTFPAAIEMMAARDGAAGEPRWLTWVEDLTERRRAEQDVARHAGGARALQRRPRPLRRRRVARPAVAAARDRRLARGSSSGAASGTSTGEERELVELIVGGVHRMTALVDGIRDYSRVRGGRAIDDALAARATWSTRSSPALRGDLDAAGARVARRRAAGGLRRPRSARAALPEPARQRGEVPRATRRP